MNGKEAEEASFSRRPPPFPLSGRAAIRPSLVPLLPAGRMGAGKRYSLNCRYGAWDVRLGEERHADCHGDGDPIRWDLPTYTKR